MAAADVASSAPQLAASRASAGPAPPCRAPRPAMNTGRRARASAAASCSTVSGGGAPPAIAVAPVTLAAIGSSTPVSSQAGSCSAACTSSGRASTTVRRSRSAVA